MRLHLLLAKVEPKAIAVPSKCRYPGCTSKQVRLHQPVKKALRDTVQKPRGSASLSLSQMWAHLPSVSAWSHPCAEFGAGQRAGGDVVSVGTLFRSGVAGLRQLGRTTLQDASVRDDASCRCTRARTQARASLSRSQDQSLRRGFDECEMCRAMVASGSHGR